MIIREKELITAKMNIEKEAITELNISKDEVLREPKLQEKRKNDLQKALSLGNSHKGKVKIKFQLEDGMQKVVDTTIWAVGQDFVTLKAGTLIPIHAIIDIEF